MVLEAFSISKYTDITWCLYIKHSQINDPNQAISSVVILSESTLVPRYQFISLQKPNQVRAMLSIVLHKQLVR